MINARAETVLTKPARSGRRSTGAAACCPPTGSTSGSAAPTGPSSRGSCTGADGRPLAMAGLWEVWRPADAGEDVPLLRTCAVITTAANDHRWPRSTTGCR